MELTQTLSQFHSPAVRDLAWAILSPPLMQLPDHKQNFELGFFESAFQNFHAHLLKLDKDPQPLLQFLESGKDKRLGVYFEKLWLYWLQHNDHYRCLAHNLQIHNKEHNPKTQTVNLQTVGELDLIVENRLQGIIEHWELSLKFYLGIAPTHKPHHWLGPNLNDRLYTKYQTLLNIQLPLSQQASAKTVLQNKGWNVQRARALSKGCLFYPLVYPLNKALQAPDFITSNHLTAAWATTEQLKTTYTDNKNITLSPLSKAQWMNLETNKTYHLEEWMEQWENQEDQRPIQLLLSDNQVSKRLFLVANEWPKQALKLIN